MVDPQAEDDPKAEDDPDHLLVVFTDEQAAREFMNEFGIQGQPRPLANDREFSWLLRRLKPPINQVAFDPRPLERDVNARWTAPVQTLLDDHLTVDFSPWNYPVFAVSQGDGFASIHSQSDTQPVTAVAIFSDSDQAEAYIAASGEQGELFELADMLTTRRFLQLLSKLVDAVALDPETQDGQHATPHCFSVRTLLDKYLVVEEEGEEEGEIEEGGV